MVSEESGRRAGGNLKHRADEADILEAFCRAQQMMLPRARRGLSAAIDLLTAIPAASRLGRSDMTVSAPQLFRMFKHAGLIADVPTACDMPAAVRLVASVCGVVVQESPRRWTVWFASACDPDDELCISLRENVTPAMLKKPSQPPGESPPRTSSIRAERDELANDLARVKVELASAKSGRKEAETELARATEQLAEYKKRADREAKTLAERKALKDELADLKHYLQYVTRERETLRSAVEAQRKLRDISQKEFGEERVALRGEVARLQSELDLCRNWIERANNELKRATWLPSLEKTVLAVQHIFRVERFDPAEPEAFISSLRKSLALVIHDVAATSEAVVVEQVEDSCAAVDQLLRELRNGAIRDRQMIDDRLLALRSVIVTVASRTVEELEGRGYFLPSE